MQHKRASILIDGSNLYFKLRYLKLHQLLTFDFSSFAQSLIGLYWYVQGSRDDASWIHCGDDPAWRNGLVTGDFAQDAKKTHSLAESLDARRRAHSDRTRYFLHR